MKKLLLTLGAVASVAAPVAAVVACSSDDANKEVSAMTALEAFLVSHNDDAAKLIGATGNGTPTGTVVSEEKVSVIKAMSSTNLVEQMRGLLGDVSWGLNELAKLAGVQVTDLDEGATDDAKKINATNVAISLGKIKAGKALTVKNVAEMILGKKANPIGTTGNYEKTHTSLQYATAKAIADVLGVSYTIPAGKTSNMLIAEFDAFKALFA